MSLHGRYRVRFVSGDGTETVSVVVTVEGAPPSGARFEERARDGLRSRRPDADDLVLVSIERLDEAAPRSLVGSPS